MTMDYLGWICAIISVIGTLCINYKNKYGMVLWIISNLLWIYYALFVQPNMPQVFMYVVFTLTNIHGLYKWKLLEKSAKP